MTKLFRPSLINLAPTALAALLALSGGCSFRFRPAGDHPTSIHHDDLVAPRLVKSGVDVWHPLAMARTSRHCSRQPRLMRVPSSLTGKSLADNIAKREMDRLANASPK